MTKSIQEQIAEFEQAITAQENLRATLGDAVVDATVAALREKMAALAQQQGGGQTRKMVTVLFADVSGSTAMAESMDPEEITDLMNALWHRLDAVIVEQGGMIDKHMGDAVMALWGVEQAREDDPERATRAALAVQAELAAFREAHHVELAMRIGVNTGPVLLGGVAGEFTAMGDTVNLASRLERMAPVGGVLISHDTYRHVRGIFDVLPQEPITVKGKAAPVKTYVVQQAKRRAFRTSTRGVEGIETHMVGRDAELLALQNAFRQALDAAHPETRVVTVVGEAGVGKSRLLYEFEHWIELLSERVWYYKGRATPAMQTIPYSIIRDMFAFRFDILESDSPARVMKKFRTGMEGILDADRADVVGHLVGFDFYSAGSQAVQNLLGSPSFSQLATAYLTNYIRAVAGGPTVIFLEDMHWADDSSLDLVDRFVTEIPKARLLIVCLARPIVFERRPHWGEGREAYTRLGLEPLSKRDSRALVAEILQKVDDIPASLRDLVVDGAEGNPFYVEELIKMLIEDGVIVPGEQEWRVALDRLKEERVPPTLTEVLQARLDCLPPEERELLQRASVVGRLFWDTAVAELAADRVDKAQVTPLLDAIRGRELIFRREHSAFENTHEYVFKHAVLRDVTYATVLLKLRRVYHAQVARWLEANARERLTEYLSLIAGHYELAGEQAKAADYLRRSGEELIKIGAYHDALGAFKRALAMLPEENTAGRAVLLAELGRAYERVGDYAAATQHLEEAQTLARQVGDQKTEAAALHGLGQVALNQGAYDQAERLLEQGLAQARASRDAAGAGGILFARGAVALRRGENKAAERYLVESLEIRRQLGDRHGIAYVFNALGMAAMAQEDYGAARQYYGESLAISTRIGNRRGVAACLNNLGELARLLEEYEEAKQCYEQALAMNREIGSRLGAVLCLGNLGHLHARLGEDEVAWRYLRETLDESSAIGAIPIALDALVGAARLRAKAGQYAPAAELLGLLLSHPALKKESQEIAEPVLAILRDKLPADHLEAALARGKALELDAVIEGVIAEILSKREK